MLSASATAFKDVGVIIEEPHSTSKYCISVEDDETAVDALQRLEMPVTYDSAMREIQELNEIKGNESHSWKMWVSTGNRAFDLFRDELIDEYDIAHSETVLAFGYFDENEGRIPTRLDHETLCPRPMNGLFRGQTTDFSAIWYQNLTQIRNLTIENEDYGLISFDRDLVNIKNYLNLDHHFSMKSMYIEMPGDGEFNNLKPHVVMYNVPYEEFTVLLDGTKCPEDVCKGIRKEGGAVVFDSETTGIFELREKMQNSFLPDEYEEEDYRISIVLSEVDKRELRCEDHIMVSVILMRYRETFINDAQIRVSIPKLNKKITNVVRMQEIFKRNYSFKINPEKEEGGYEILIEVLDPNESLIISKTIEFSKKSCTPKDTSGDLDASSIDVVITEGDTSLSEENQQESFDNQVDVETTEQETKADEPLQDEQTEVQVSDTPEPELEEPQETEEERRARLEKEDAERLERALALAEQREAIDSITGSVVEEPPKSLGLVEKLVKFVILPLVGVAILAFAFVKVKNEYDKYMVRVEKEIEEQIKQKKK